MSTASTRTVIASRLIHVVVASSMIHRSANHWTHRIYLQLCLALDHLVPCGNLPVTLQPPNKYHHHESKHVPKCAIGTRVWARSDQDVSSTASSNRGSISHATSLFRIDAPAALECSATASFIIRDHNYRSRGQLPSQIYPNEMLLLQWRHPNPSEASGHLSQLAFVLTLVHLWMLLWLLPDSLLYQWNSRHAALLSQMQEISWCSRANALPPSLNNHPGYHQSVYLFSLMHLTCIALFPDFMFP